MDVTTAFLHGEVEEEIYMSQPKGFEMKGKEHLVCRLLKSLYGLKQSPRQWYKRFDKFIQTCGFVRSMYDNCVYIKREKGVAVIYLLLYVDDMLITSHSTEKIEEIKMKLKTEFEMKDIGLATKILSMNISRDRELATLNINQFEYIDKIVNKFSLQDAKPVTVPIAHHFKLSKAHSPKTEEDKKHMQNIPYSNAVGSLMYGMTCSRLDLAFAMSTVSRYMCDPGKPHWEVVKWIIRYVKGTLRHGLIYSRGNSIENSLIGYSDADFAADVDKRRSITGYVFTLFGNTISWKSQL